MEKRQDKQGRIDAETARQQALREQRLAAALRANLRRRKAPLRGESTSNEPPADET